MKDDIIKCKVTVRRQFYPKGKKMEGGDWGILACEVVEVIEGEPEINKIWNTITIKGICPY